MRAGSAGRSSPESARRSTAVNSIFLSYRRSDSGGYAGRLYDRLSEAFGKEHVFMDVDSISFGEDFVETIAKTLRSCKVFLVLIGPTWLSATDSSGRRRLDLPTDIVRVEVVTALAEGI